MPQLQAVHNRIAQLADAQLQGAAVGKSMSEDYRSEIKGAKARRLELVKALDETNLTLNQPPRVTILERATESK